MKLSTLTPIAAVLAVSLAGMTHADTNPFAAKTVTTMTLAEHHEGSCGGMKKDETAKEGMKEGSCGGMKTAVEGKVAGMKEGKCGADKAMKEGKCGAAKMKAHKEGKCGEGKCGAKKKAAEAKAAKLKSTAEVKASAVTPAKN